MPDPTSGMTLPPGYTPDTVSSYYRSMVQPIDMDTERAKGSARGDALARGLEGTPTETGGVAAADYYGGLRKDALLSGLAFNMAGLSNQDTMIKQQQDWTAGESEKSRGFTANQNQLDRFYGFDRMNKENDMDKEAALWGMGSRMMGSVAGGYGGGMGMG